MAHAARISDLTDGLVRSVAGDRSQHASLRRMRDQAAKTFRNTTHARTNQFDVQSKLTGLVEKFAVLNRDDLSDALQARLDELPRDSKWMPEILSLLLQLSDRPLEKTKIEDVEMLSRQPQDEQSDFTWEDLVAERVLDETGLWDDVDRGHHSSGDEADVSDEADSDDTGSTRPTSIGDDTVATAKLHIVQTDESVLNEFGPAERKFHSSVSEVTIIRETLFMLRGLPTDIFGFREGSGDICIWSKVYIETAAQATTRGLLLRFTKIGSALNNLRAWSKQREKRSYLQSCQAATLSLLADFDREISAIEQRHVAPAQDTVVSMICVLDDVDTVSKPLVHLSRIILASNDLDSSPFALLDALYDEISITEMSGDKKVFRALVEVFLSGLKTYLRPLSLWIQTGSVDRNCSVSMILEASPDCDRGKLWSDRFALQSLSDGNVCCPKLMRRMANKIFTIGKGRAFLLALGGEDEIETDLQGSSTKLIDFSQGLKTLQLLPFTQLLDESLERWVVDVSRDSGFLLQRKLLHDHGLMHTVNRLAEVFCSKDGVLFQTFANTLFSRIDDEPNAWRHDFLLSELASSTFGDGDGMRSESLSVTIHEDAQSIRPNSSIRQLRSIHLHTTFPWPVQNITHTKSSEVHSRAFALLLQTYRAKYLLQPQALDLKRFTPNADNTASILKPALILRQRLICFVNILHDHTTSTARVLHTMLRIDLEAARDIDAMAAAWNTHVKGMDSALLLAQKLNPIREAIIGCLELCEQLARLWPKDVRPQTLAEENGCTKLATMRHELDKSMSFIVAGVRSVGRVSGNKMLEELAERLELVAPS